MTAEGTTRIVLVTGTSSGIGLATAVAAAQSGWHVVATMRDTAKSGALVAAAEAAGVAGRVEVRRLDVTDPASVSSCLADVLAAHGHLDALVNNAGAGVVGTVEQGGTELFRSAMEVNFFGVVEVTGAAMPHLRAAGGRVVTVTSVGGVVGQPFNEAYCAAKFAAEGFLESLAPVAASVGVKVTVVEPGAVASEFVASQDLDIPAMVAAAGPYGPALESYVARTRTAFAAAQSSADAAAVVVDVLNAAEPPFRVQTSDAARAFVSTKLSDRDGAAVQKLTTSWVGL